MQFGFCICQSKRWKLSAHTKANHKRTVSHRNRMDRNLLSPRIVKTCVLLTKKLPLLSYHQLILKTLQLSGLYWKLTPIKILCRQCKMAIILVMCLETEQPKVERTESQIVDEEAIIFYLTWIGYAVRWVASYLQLIKLDLIGKLRTIVPCN